ncbi:hypothetical protein ACI2OX_14995 [Bacillus sp. N9]
MVAKETDIDGYYLPNMTNVPLSFVENFTAKMKAADPTFYISASIPTASYEEMRNYIEAGIDNFMDTKLNTPLREAFAQPDQSLQPIFDVLDESQATVRDLGQLSAFFDDRHMERFTRDMVKANEYPGPRWKLGLTYLYTQPEIPVIYYASELAVDGGVEPENRSLMGFRADQELIDFIARLGKFAKNKKH